MTPEEDALERGDYRALRDLPNPPDPIPVDRVAVAITAALALLFCVVAILLF